MAILRSTICMYLLCLIWGARVNAMPCPSGIFAFGDSLTDTGNYATLYPSMLHYDYQKFTDVLHDSSTNNSSIFKSSKFLPYRAGDGRLLIDFITEAFSFPFLNANYRSGQDFSHGVNFAVSAATARDTAIAVPYYLSIQVKSFMQWNTNGWISPNLVSKGMFFMFIGLNDFWQNCMNNRYSATQIKSVVVPDAVKSISNAIYNLHLNGARNLMILGVPAVGCLPSFIKKFGTGVASDYDSFGCLSAHNDAANAFNSMLYNAIQNAQANMPDSNFLFANVYQLHMNIVASPSSYGFFSGGTTTACCINGACCTNPSSYITWDGLHFTDNFNRVVATKFLKENFMCALDFGKF